jgi:hypothetical protein
MLTLSIPELKRSATGTTLTRQRFVARRNRASNSSTRSASVRHSFETRKWGSYQARIVTPSGVAFNT